MIQDWAFASASIHDASQFAEALTQTDISCIQTSSGPIRLEATLAKLSRLGVHLTAMPVGSCAAIGQTPADTVSFHIPLSSPHCLSIMGQRMQSDSIAVYAPSSEQAVRAQSGARLAYLIATPDVFSSHAFAGAGRENPVRDWKSGIRSADVASLARLRCAIEQLGVFCAGSPEAFEHPEAIKSIKYAILEQLAGALAQKPKGEPSAGRSPVSRSHILAAVDNYLRLYGNGPIFVADLCVAAGVSQPTLFRTFEDVFGIGPKQFLQIRRLHQVRRKLLDGNRNLSISSVAYDYGFWQLGRFGRAYKALFGETPSQTLRARSQFAGSLLHGLWPTGSLGDVWIRCVVKSSDQA